MTLRKGVSLESCSDATSGIEEAITLCCEKWGGRVSFLSRDIAKKQLLGVSGRIARVTIRVVVRTLFSRGKTAGYLGKSLPPPLTT